MENAKLFYGAYVNLQNLYFGATRSDYLESYGLVKDVPEITIAEQKFVFTSNSKNQSSYPCTWQILPANGKNIGDEILIGDEIHLKSVYPEGGYLDTCATPSYLPDVYQNIGDQLLVFTSESPSRDGKSGTWKIISPSNKSNGDTLLTSDEIHLLNCYSSDGFENGGYLDTLEYKSFLPVFKNFPDQNGLLVFTSSSPARDGKSGTWQFSLNHDYYYSKMIPLELHSIVPVNFSVKLCGSSFKGNSSCAMLFDTGGMGVPAIIPYQYLAPSNIEVVENALQKENEWVRSIIDRSVHFPYRVDKVKGQVGLKSEDGTEYLLENYEFYAFYEYDEGKKGGYTLQEKTNQQIDEHLTWNATLLGVFPTGSTFISALINKYADGTHQDTTPGKLGMGIMNKRPGGDITKDWPSLKPYLQIGFDPNILQDVRWRTDIPNGNPSYSEFTPEVVPGFDVTVKISDQNPVKISDLNMTIDTGYSVLSVFPFDGSSVFENGSIKAPDTAQITVEFTDSQGKTSSFQWIAKKSEVVAPIGLKVNAYYFDEKKKIKRGFLGNSVFLYCPIVFWDISNKRVGISFS